MNNVTRKVVDLYRVVVYIPRERYLQLRAKLIAKGMTVSRWFRDKVDEELNSKQ